MGNVYVLYGANELSIRDFIRKNTSKRVYFDQPHQIKEAVENLLQKSLFSDEATPVLLRLLSSANDSDLSRMVKSGKDLFFWETGLPKSTKSKLIKGIVVKEFVEPGEGETKNWLRKESQKRELNISDAVVNRLYVLHGGNLLILQSELDRLQLLLQSGDKGGGSINLEDLSVHKTAESSIFSLQDAIGERDGDKFVAEMAGIAKEVDPWYLFSVTVNHLRKMLQIKAKVTLQVHPFVKKKLTQQAQYWSEVELIDQLHKLLQIEFEVKKGEVELLPMLMYWFLTDVARDAT